MTLESPEVAQSLGVYFSENAITNSPFALGPEAHVQGPINFRTRPKVEDYAKELHVSTKHLISICKTNSGKTPLKIIQDEIIGEAKRLLFYTENPIKEIAMTLGFDDPGNFSNFFKTTTGYSPISYREKSK